MKVQPDSPGIWRFRHENGCEEEIPIIWEALGPKVWDLVPYGDELPGRSLAEFRGAGEWTKRTSGLPAEMDHLGKCPQG